MSDSDKSIVAAIGEKFGDRFSSEKGLNKLASRLDEAANIIGARGEGVTLVEGSNKPLPFSGGRVSACVCLGPRSKQNSLK